MIQHREAVMGRKADGPGLGEPREGRLGELGTGSQGWKGGYTENGDSARSHMEKTRGNGCKLPLGRIPTGHQRTMVDSENNEPLEQSPKGMVEPPTWGTAQLKRVLGHLV